MAAISAIMVKELREKTGAGMLDCKNALTDADGDMEKAIEVLRKKGIASAAKKSSRLASEGLIHIFQGDGVAALVEVNCETDFVGKNEDFQDFVKKVAEHVAKHRPGNMEELLSQEFAGGKSTEVITQEKVAKIGENISIRRFDLKEAGPGENIGSYTHMGSKIGSIVRIKGNSDKIGGEVAKGVAMHVAAVSPRFVRAEDIPQEVLDKEREIFQAQMKDSGKPPEILDKIIDGKLKKFATEVCLEDQIYIKDSEGKATVSKYLKSMDPEAQIIDFVRFQVGEGMEKKEEDFAAEVAKQLK
ncbi:MAG: translation elongation factor Ts [bacterium]|nr:translation elongation factor Ts [bacterium]